MHQLLKIFKSFLLIAFVLFIYLLMFFLFVFIVFIQKLRIAVSVSTDWLYKSPLSNFLKTVSINLITKKKKKKKKKEKGKKRRNARDCTTKSFTT